MPDFKKAPEEIYLQNEDYDPGDEFDSEGVSWSDERLNDSDIEYIRSDIYWELRQRCADAEIGKLEGEIKLTKILTMVKEFAMVLGEDEKEDGK